jgi:predicted nucleic acid-binding protein
MNLLVSDTGPLNYLIQIECVGLLHEIATDVLVPVSVLNELKSEMAPDSVRNWAFSLPDWLRVVDDPEVHLDPSSSLSKTDLAVIQLASLENAILVMDESHGREMARSLNVPVIGTVGILLLGAELGLVDFPSALARIKQTNMFLSPNIIQDAWTRYRAIQP